MTFTSFFLWYQNVILHDKAVFHPHYVGSVRHPIRGILRIKLDDQVTSSPTFQQDAGTLRYHCVVWMHANTGANVVFLCKYALFCCASPRFEYHLKAYLENVKERHSCCAQTLWMCTEDVRQCVGAVMDSFVHTDSNTVSESGAALSSCRWSRVITGTPLASVYTARLKRA